MSRLTPIFFILLALKNTEGAVTPVVTLTPNWNNVYSGDRVTLSCSVGSVEEDKPRYYYYTWHKDDKLMYEMRKTLIITAKVADTGVYKCSVESGIYSNPVRLHVISGDYLILQAPSDIIEGDSLSLRCHNRPGSTATGVTHFYKDNELSGSTDDILHIPNVNTSMSGTYKCEKYFDFVIKDQWKSAEKYINVQELFPTPEIQSSPYSIQEGDEMTVRCHTTLNPLRGGTELHFAFYRDGRTVREFGISNTYRVRSSQLEDSGNYTCEVRTTSDTVRKMSDEIHIQIYELFSPPQIKVTPSRVIEGDEMTVRCDTRLDPLRGGTELHFAFYRDGRTVREFSISNKYRDGWTVQGYYVSDTYKVTSAKLEDSGKYTCEVRTASDTVRKDSNAFPVQIKELFTSPEIRVGPSLLVEEGKQVTLTCVTDPKGSTNLLYTFYKDSQIVQSAHRKTSYVIGKAGEENSGSYKCSVQSRDGKVIKNSTDVHILIQSPISDVRVTVDKGDFVYGKSLTLYCSVEKGTSPVFLWWHNETVVDQDAEFYQLRENGAVLYIQSLQSHHVGSYRCQVSNKLSAIKPSFAVETFQISQNPPLGESTFPKVFFE
ncbi:Fc receptor-like protein 5 [Rana temporaria]|uniref:Fc receptor-like protein 5 n=1 Tax=Rana temporaria TaxID=8407 RepID=UPI001AAC733C|nr:Fc receptor-like protein 5 [Rana temporaria]